MLTALRTDTDGIGSIRQHLALFAPLPIVLASTILDQAVVTTGCVVVDAAGRADGVAGEEQSLVFAAPAPLALRHDVGVNFGN